MKRSTLASILALATATFATQQSICKYRDTDDPEVDVTFVKFDADNCSGLDSGGEQKVEHGDCKNFDFGFQSYYYKTASHWMWNDNDGEDCRCFVMVYPEGDCQGQPYCLGPVVDTCGVCTSLKGLPIGMSAMVRCDNGDGTEQFDTCKASPLFTFMPPPPESAEED